MTLNLYILLTPIFLLGVMGLLGFVGCDLVFNLDEVPPVIDGPIITATPGNRMVTVTWEDFPTGTSFEVSRGTTMGGPYPDKHTVLPSEIPFVDTDVTNGTTYCYVVTAQVGNRETSPSNESCATPQPSGQFTSFVDMPPVLGMLHNMDAGFFGMKIVVGANPIHVEQLGRYFIPGNGATHEMRIVDVSTLQTVPNSQVMVDITKGSPNEFVYEAVTGPVTLMAGHSYYIVCQETGADEYCLDTTVIHHTGVATVPNAASGDGVNFSPTAGVDNTYGPVSFSYS